jgi:hypothetical protein
MKACDIYKCSKCGSISEKDTFMEEQEFTKERDILIDKAIDDVKESLGPLDFLELASGGRLKTILFNRCPLFEDIEDSICKECQIKDIKTALALTVDKIKQGKMEIPKTDVPKVTEKRTETKEVKRGGRTKDLTFKVRKKPKSCLRRV